MKILKPLQKFHPDDPARGWTCTVLGADGLLLARFYGSSAEKVEKLAQRFVEAG